MAQNEDQFTKETAIKSRDQFQNLYSIRSKNAIRKNSIKNKIQEFIQEPLIEESNELVENDIQNDENILEEKKPLK